MTPLSRAALLVLWVSRPPPSVRRGPPPSAEGEKKLPPTRISTHAQHPRRNITEGNDVHALTSPGSSTNRSCPGVTVSSSFASSLTMVPDLGEVTETSIYTTIEQVRNTRKYFERKLGFEGEGAQCVRTLSVSMLATSSSAATVSPTCFDHDFSVPSLIESAMRGTLTVSSGGPRQFQYQLFEKTKY